jgi:Co/Zn/Cd efflux system component
MTRQPHCSAHDHAHGHSTWAGRALMWVALVYLAYGATEIVVARMLGESAALLSADGTHNLLDGLSYLVFYAFDRVLKRHDRARSWSHVLLGVAGPVSYLVGFFLPGLHDHGHDGPMTAQGTSLMIALGTLSYLLAKRCHRHGDGENAGLSAHLAGDMAGAAGVVLAALVLPFVPGAEMFIGGATFGVMACVAYVELKPLLHALNQSRVHDHEAAHEATMRNLTKDPVLVQGV